MDTRPKVSERSFGISVGGVLCAVAAILLWRRHPIRAEIAGSLGSVLLVLGLTVPAALKVPNAVWSRISNTLAVVSTRVLITVLFAVVITPLGLAWKLAGADPLQRRRDRWRGWRPHPARYRDNNHFRRMY